MVLPDYFRIERSVLTSQDSIDFIADVNKILRQTLSLNNNELFFQFTFQDPNYSGVGNILQMMDRTLKLVNNTSENVTLHFDKSKTGNNDNTTIIKKLGHLLGFRSANAVVDSNSSLKLPCSLDLISFKYAYLVIDDFHSNGETNIVAEDVYSVPCAQNMKFGGNILAKINYKNDANYNVTNRIITTPRCYYGNIDISKLRITLVNEFGDLIDTHGADWAFTLSLSCSYN